MLELLGDVRDLVGVAGVADLLRDVGAVARDAEATRENLVARILEDRDGLTRQEGFVNLKVVGILHARVNDHLVAPAEQDEVVNDYLLLVNRDLPAVTHDVDIALQAGG